MTLYEIGDELEAIETAILDAEGVITPEIAVQLEAMEGALETKVEGICQVVARLARQADSAKLEADRLTKLATGRQNAADSLKHYLQKELVRLDRKKVDTRLFVVSVCRNSRPSIAWTEGLDALPECYRKVVTSLDGNAALEEYKAAGELPEGFVVNVGSHLRIR